MRICIWQAGAKMATALCDYCIEQEEFELWQQWDKDKNEVLTACDVSYGSHKSVKRVTSGRL